MKRVIMCVLLFSLPGCVMVGPNYHQPCLTMPTKYSQQRDSQGPLNLCLWWTFFDDPCLTELIEKAARNNYDFLIAIEKINEKRALYGVQKALLFPEIDNIDAFSRTQYSKQLLQYSFLTTSRLSFLDIGFQTAWELDFWGRIRREANALYDELQAQIEDMRDVYIIVLAEVANSYIDIRSLQKKIDVRQRQVDVNKQLLCLQKDLFASGVASDIVVEQQRQALDESESTVIIMKTMLVQAVNGLAILLGDNPEGFTFCEGPQQVPVPKKEISLGIPSDLLRRRPDIREAERTLAAATERIGGAIADYFPSFSLFGNNVSFQSNCINNIFAPGALAWTFGPSISWPLITFGRITFNVEAKKSICRQALLAYAQTVKRVLGDVENALVAYFNERERVGIIEKEFAAAQKGRDLTKALYESGLASQIDYLTTEKDCLDIEWQLTDTEQSFSAAVVVLYKALGGGWDECTGSL